MGWDPSLYLRFEEYRTRPARELLSRVDVATPRDVVDLGCGPGNSTELLFARWPDARVTGLDLDDAMLAAAARRHPSRTWTKADVATWEPDTPVDVLFSNATLHWLPDHARLYARLFSFVAPGGAFAAQVPNNHAAADHRLIDEVLARGPWGARGARLERRYGVSAPAVYYDALAGAGAARVDVWETEYWHVLDRPEDVVTWMRGTGLRPALEALRDDERDAFVAEYTEALRAEFPVRADGRVLFPFRRLFVVAMK